MLQSLKRRHLSTTVIDFALLYKPGGLENAVEQVKHGNGDFTIYARLLRLCRDKGTLVQGKTLHEAIVQDGLQNDSILGNLLVEMYTRRGGLDEACQVLEKIPTTVVAVWTKLLTAFAQNGQCNEAFAVLRKMQQVGTTPNNVTLVTILSCCETFEQVKRLHGYAMELLGWEREDVCLSTAVLTAYGRLGKLQEARNVFSWIHFPDLVSWTALITAHALSGHCMEALEIYRIMLSEGMLPNRVTCLGMLAACTNIGNLAEGKMLHSHVKEAGWDNTVDIMVNNVIVCMYDKCGSLQDAKSAFDEMPRRDVVSWTSLISAYTQRGKYSEAFHLSRMMKLEGERPNNVTFMALLEAASSGSFSSTIAEVELIHRHIVEDGWDVDVLVATSLVTTYGRFKQSLDHALAIFRKLSYKRMDDIILWNSMLSSYAQHGFRTETLAFLEKLEEKFEPDNVTYVAALSVLAGPEWLFKGRILHEGIMKHGYDFDLVVSNALVTMYGKCGSFQEAGEVFESMTVRSVISWNTMVAACAQNGEPAAALWYFRRMQLEGFSPDVAGLTTMLYACTCPEALSEGKHLEAQVFSRGLHNDTNVANALVVMFSRCGSLEQAVSSFREMVAVRDIGSWNALISAYGLYSKYTEAKQAFLEMPDRDVGSWNALLVVLAAQKETCSEAFLMFQKMQVDGIIPNTITLITVINACTTSGAISQGRSVHKFSTDNSLFTDMPVATAIVNMYAKHGCLLEARRVFNEEAQKRDVVTWNALLAGYSQHGQGLETLLLFKMMQLEGMCPDKSTLVSVLHACCHLGWVKQGCEYFSCIADDYGFLPHDEHFNCIVDMLGRAGHLQDAEEFMGKNMQVRADVVTWMSLLGSCRMHGDLVRGTTAAKKVAGYKTHDSAADAMLVSMYEMDKINSLTG